MFIITKEWLELNKTPKGGYLASQVKSLGFAYPPKKGWLASSVGKEIDEMSKKAFEGGSISKSQARKLAKEARKGKRKSKLKAIYKEVEQIRRSSNPVKVKPLSDGFLSSYEWRKVRMVAIKKYGNSCQCCGASPKDGIVINVDHIKPRKTHPELALDVSNLQILCNVCNHGKGNWDDTDWRVN